MRVANVVDVNEQLNPIFFNAWLTDKPNKILSGGRSSFKSSYISLELVVKFLEDEKANVVVLRKVAKYLRDSVYNQIVWAIETLGVSNQFIFRSSPLKIIHKKTNTGFYFYGVDDPQKIKSAKVAKGYVRYIWYEELAEFDGVEDIDIVQDTFLRQKIEGDAQVITYFSYNPPRSQHHWVNEWVKQQKTKSDVFYLHTTYKDDRRGFLSQQMVNKILDYKKTDYEYYQWMYLGNVIGLGHNVYNTDTFNKIPYEDFENTFNKVQVLQGDTIIDVSLGIDTGHMVSATTVLALGYTRAGNIILLDTYYYDPSNKAVKKSTSEYSDDIKEFIDNIERTYNLYVQNITIDSAEGALRNQLYRDHNIVADPVGKLNKMVMIDYAANVFSSGRFYYIDNKNNKIFIDEHKRYTYDKKTLKTPNVRVVEVDDHTCDAFQYYVVNNRMRLGLA